MWFKTLLLSAALTSCATVQGPAASFSESTPINISMDVAPGYRDSVFLGIPEDGALELTVQNLKLNPSKKWKPTFYLSFNSDKSDINYYFNLSVDTDLNKMFGRVRLIDMKAKKELLNRIHQQLYSLDHQFHLRISIDQAAVTVHVDGVLVDQQELSYEPELIELGASSGSFNVRLIKPPPPPAPE